jgi:sensor c-di-GMP phosphodiesterase-like protein
MTDFHKGFASIVAIFVVALALAFLSAQRPEKQDTNSMLRRIDDRVERLEQRVGDHDEHMQKLLEQAANALSAACTEMRRPAQ